MRGRQERRAEDFGLGAATRHSRVTYVAADVLVTAALYAVAALVPVLARIVPPHALSGCATLGATSIEGGFPNLRRAA